jgi:sulfoxide reductase heme-binding subunit YedZ
VAELMWFLTRASGIVALVLILVALADGLIFSGHEGGRRLRPAWWLDLHKGLGGYALVFTGLHLVTAFGAHVGAGLAQILLPGTSPTSTTAFTLGVFAFYGLAVTVFSSWPSHLFRRRTWHLLHLLSIPTAVAAAVHTWQLGTDAAAPWFAGLAVLATGAVMYPVGLRLTGLARRRMGRTIDDDPASDERALVGSGR